MRKLIAAALLLGLGLPAQAAELDTTHTTSPATLPLSEFIARACEKDTAFQTLLIDELKLNYQPILALPAEDLFFEVTGRYQYDLIEAESGEPEASLSLSKLFSNSGTQLASEYSLAQNTLINEYRSAFALEIAQPIAQNAFGRANRLQKEIAGIETDLARYQLTEAYEDYLASLITRYYDWAAAYSQWQTSLAALAEHRKLLAQVVAQQASKIADQTDVDKIQLQLLSDQETALDFSTDFQRLTYQIEQGLGMAETRDSPAWRPELPGVDGMVEIDFSAVYDRVIRESRTWRMLGLLETRSTKTKTLSADELLPSAFVSAGYQTSGRDWQFDNTDRRIYAAASLGLPLPGSQARARHEISTIEEKKTIITASLKRRQLATDLKTLHAQIQQQKKRLALTADKIRRAEAVVASETRDYRYGHAALDDLIAAIQILETARGAKITQTLALFRLMTEWQRITDQLVRDAARPSFSATR